MRTWISNINFNELSVSDRGVLATEYADGSKSLREVILLLWNNKIKVESCCRGYTDAELEKMEDQLDVGNQPSICFNTRGLSRYQVEALLVEAVKVQNVYDIMFGLYDYEGSSNNSLTIVLDKRESTFDGLIPAFKKIFDPNLKMSEIDAKFASLNNKTQTNLNRILNALDFELKNIDLSELKERYLYFPQGMYGIEYNVFKGGSTAVGYSLTDTTLDETADNGNYYIYSDAYYTYVGGRYYIVQDGELTEISKADIDELGYISREEFEKIRNLYLPEEASTFDRFILNR